MVSDLFFGGVFEKDKIHSVLRKAELCKVGGTTDSNAGRSMMVAMVASAYAGAVRPHSVSASYARTVFIRCSSFPVRKQKMKMINLLKKI